MSPAQRAIAIAAVVGFIPQPPAARHCPRALATSSTTRIDFPPDWRGRCGPRMHGLLRQAHQEPESDPASLTANLPAHFHQLFEIANWAAGTEDTKPNGKAGERLKEVVRRFRAIP